MHELKGDLLNQAINAWVEDYSAIKNFTEKTKLNKRELFCRLKRFLRNEAFNLQNVELYLKQLREKGCHPDPKKSRPWQPSSILDEVRFLRAFVRYLARKKYITEDFSEQIEKPKVPDKIKDMVSIEQAEKIILVGTEPNKYSNILVRMQKREARMALQFLNRTPLRVSELLGIRGEDLQLEATDPMIRVKRKGGKWCNVVCPPDMVEILKKRTDFKKVFITTEKTINTSLERGIKKLGLKVHITAHAFRRIQNTELIDRGAPISHTSDLLGHSDITITKKIYTQHSVKSLAQTQKLYNPLLVKHLTVEERIKHLRQIIEGSGALSDGLLTISSDSKQIVVAKVEV